MGARGPKKGFKKRVVDMSGVPIETTVAADPVIMVDPVIDPIEDGGIIRFMPETGCMLCVEHNGKTRMLMLHKNMIYNAKYDWEKEILRKRKVKEV